MAEFPAFRYNQTTAQWEKKTPFLSKPEMLPIYVGVTQEEVPNHHLHRGAHGKAHQPARRATSGQRYQTQHDSPPKRQKKTNVAAPTNQPQQQSSSTAQPPRRRASSQQPAPRAVNKTRRAELDQGAEFVPTREQLVQANEQNAANIRAMMAEFKVTSDLIMPREIDVDHFDGRAVKVGEVVQASMEKNQQLELDGDRIDRPARAERVKKVTSGEVSKLNVANWYKLVFSLPDNERGKLEKSFAKRVEDLFKRPPLPDRKPFLNALGICAYCHVHRDDATELRHPRHEMNAVCPYAGCDCVKCYAMDQIGPMKDD